MATLQPSQNFSEPKARFWHISQCVGGKLYIWGGRIIGETKEKALRTVNEFDTRTGSRSWHERETKGDPHPGFSQVASAAFGKYLYLYGGSDGEELNGVLSRLDLETMMWSQLSPENAVNGPMKKDACGMVHFRHQNGKHKLVIMCGYAQPFSADCGSSDKMSNFEQDSKNTLGDGVHGWTNEVHAFDITNEHGKIFYE